MQTQTKPLNFRHKAARLKPRPKRAARPLAKEYPPSVQEFIGKYGPYFGKERLNQVVQRGRFLVEARAEGAYIYTPERRRYLDFFCESGVYNLGHRNPVMLDAVTKALHDETYGGIFYFSEVKGELARLLVETAPKGLDAVLPVVGGGEANDLAVKLAMAATGRTEIICGTRAYHGSAGLAVFMGPPHLREWFPLNPFSVKRVDLGDLDGLRAAISEKTAAVIYEPFRTLSDGFRPGSAYWSAVRSLCDQHGTILLIDEVVAGMGRMGSLWASEIDGVRPDILVTAKGLSGGMFPISAVLLRKHMLKCWGDVPFRSYSTFAWMPAGAIAARTAIKETQRLLPGAVKMAARLESGLREVGAAYPDIVTNVRRTGMHCVMEFDKARLTGLEFTNHMFKRGVLLHAAGSIIDAPAKFLPPLILSKEHISECLEKADDALQHVKNSGVARKR